MSVLYVVATPIGNMEDLSPRALRVLGEVSLIAAEDTRRTGAMLNRLGVATPLLSNHGFNERARVKRLLEALAAGDVALVTDAGTPAISDPGAILVRAAAEEGHAVTPIPGPSAVTAAISASGLIDGPFLFLGFLPRPAGERSGSLVAALRLGYPLVIYERGNRVESLVALIADAAPSRFLAIFRELTKLHEQALRAPASEMLGVLGRTTRKGEFVVVVGEGAQETSFDLDRLIQQALEDGERPSDIARELAKETGMSRSDIYARILERANRDQGA